MYVGHLIVAHQRWLAHVSARESGQRPAYCLHSAPPDCGTGDPVFALDGREERDSIVAYARVAFRTITTATEALRNWGASIGASDLVGLCSLFPALPPVTSSSAVTMLMLTNWVTINPPLQLRSIGIERRSNEGYWGLEADEVLALLKALPPGAQTPWTARVVARNNDIEV